MTERGNDDASYLLDLAPAFALDALDDAERSQIEASVARSDISTRVQFSTTVREMREAMAITSSSTSAQPSAELRWRILDAVDQLEQSRSSDGSVVSMSARRARSPKWRMALAAAAAAAVVVVGVAGLVVSQQLTDGSTEPGTSQVLVAADVRVSTSEVTGGGTATVQFSRSENAAVVTLDGLATPATGRQLEMWLIDGDSAPRSVGLVAPDAVGSPQLISGLGSAGTFALSVEPLGGSPAPTTTPITAVALDA